MSEFTSREEMLDYFRAAGTKGGTVTALNMTQLQRIERARKAGAASAMVRKESMTPEQRQTLAKKAAAARWGKEKTKN